MTTEFRVMTSGAFTAAHLALIPQLERLKKVKVVARSSIAFAVRAGTPRPDIGSADALRRTLLQVP